MKVEIGDTVEVVILRTIGEPENPRPVKSQFVVGDITHTDCVWDTDPSNSGYNACFIDELKVIKKANENKR